MIQITLFGGSAYMAVFLLRSKKFNSTKSDVQTLQARLSQLRLALKAKVRRKSNMFRVMKKTAAIEGDIFDSTNRSLCEIKFENSNDFQMYFDLSKQLVKIISIENHGEGFSEATIENNFMSNDFKTEMEIIRIIKEMTDLSSKINNRIEDHNRTSSGAQKIQRVDSLIFPSMTEVNRIFKSTDLETPTPSGSQDAVVAPDPSTEKAS